MSSDIEGEGRKTERVVDHQNASSFGTRLMIPIEWGEDGMYIPTDDEYVQCQILVLHAWIDTLS